MHFLSRTELKQAHAQTDRKDGRFVWLLAIKPAQPSFACVCFLSTCQSPKVLTLPACYISSTSICQLVPPQQDVNLMQRRG